MDLGWLLIRLQKTACIITVQVVREVYVLHISICWTKTQTLFLFITENILRFTLNLQLAQLIDPTQKKPLLIIGCPGGETGPQQIQLFRNFQCDLAEPAFTTQQSTAGKISGNMFMFFLEKPPRLTPSLGHSVHIDRGSYKTPGNSQNVWCLNALTDKSRPGKWYITHKEWGQRGRQIVVLGE